MDTIKGLIFDIKKFAIHDGPGIRTTVFMKGCPLRCAWCHNPESWKREPEILFYERNCIGCGKCFEVCPSGALRLEDGQRIYDCTICRHCWQCTEVCYAEATVKCGREATVEEVMAEVEKDLPFYQNSGGGMTVSGGEPTQQADFVRALMAESKRRGIHTALDTCGYARWEVLERLLEVTDLVLYDLKHIDSKRHRALTGVPNEPILTNLQRMAEKGIPFVVRIPVVPAHNDDEANIRGLGRFLSALKGGTVKAELLPYHRLAQSKYERLEMEYPLKDLEAPEREALEPFRDILTSYGLDARVG